MRRNILQMKYLWVALMVALATTACRDDVMRDYFPEEELTKETELREDVEVDAFITLNVPHMMGVQPRTSTRALTGEQEKVASNIKVLAFDVPSGSTAEAEETLSYEPRLLSTPTLNPTTGVYQVKVRLKTKANRQRLVILANYPTNMGTLQAGTTKDALYKSMQADYLKWKVDGEKTGAVAGTDYDLLPMWGESDTQLVTENSMKITFGDFQQGMPLQNTIYLYRSLARIDVGLAFQDQMTEDNTSGETPKLDAEGVKDFKLKSVRIYRYNSKYQIPGSQAAFGTQAQGTGTTQVITSPRIPEGSTLKGTDAALVYEVDPNSGKLVRTIYIPESRKPTSTKTGDQKDAELRDNATCIVVGGIYTGKVGNTVQSGNTKETYYRVDFLEGGHQTAPSTEQEKIYMDILRNNRYRINITKVGGPGFDTPEEALKHNDYAIFYTVSVWNNADLSRVITDGQYMLGIDKDNFTFGRSGEVQLPNAVTDWPEGWTAEVLPDEKGTKPEWLSLDKERDGVQSTKCDIQSTDEKFRGSFYGPLPIRVKEYTQQEIDASSKDGKTPQPRYAKVKLKAGRMEWILTITQKPKDPPLLRLLAGKSEIDTDEWARDAQKQRTEKPNPNWGNWKLTEQKNDGTPSFAIQVLADGSRTPKKAPLHGKQARLSFNGNTSHDAPMNYDQRVLILQWGPKEAKAKAGSSSSHDWGKETNKDPILYINALTSLEFDIQAFSSDPELTVVGGGERLKVQPLDGSVLENRSDRAFDYTTYLEGIKEYADAPNTIILLVTAKGLEGNEDPFETKLTELEFVLDVRDGSASNREESINTVQDDESVLKMNLILSQQEYSAIPYFEKEMTTSLLKWVPGTQDNHFVGKYEDAQQGMFVMDGSEQKFFARANTPYRIELITQELVGDGQFPTDGSVRDADSTNAGLLIRHFYGTPGTDNTPPKYDDFRTPGVVVGEPITFTSVNDLNTFVRQEGLATFRIVSNSPTRKLFRDSTFTIKFVSGVVQPEANCYMMKSGSKPILIPVSQLNRAKEFYYKVLLEQPVPQEDVQGGNKTSERDNSPVFTHRLRGLGKQDFWEPHLEWAQTTWGGYQKPVQADGSALLKRLDKIGTGSSGFILVQAGNYKTGNALITIKDKDGIILWSWHLWILDEYPYAVSHVGRPDNFYATHGNMKKQYWMDRNLGAITRFPQVPGARAVGQIGGDMPSGEAGEYDWRRLLSYGFLYQYGRKDPFPTVTTEERHFFSNEEGGRYDFSSLGRMNFNEDPSQRATFSIQQRVSIPGTIVSPSSPVYNRQHFLIEQSNAYDLWGTVGNEDIKGLAVLYFIWGGRMMEAFGDPAPVYPKLPNNEFWYGWETYKTPFDPSPYGWKVPAMGAETYFGKEEGLGTQNLDAGTMEGFFEMSENTENKAGGLGNKTNFNQVSIAGEDPHRTFGLPGTIYQGAYDARGTRGISVLQRYRSYGFVRENDNCDDWRDFTNETIESGDGLRSPGYWTSSSFNPTATVGYPMGIHIRAARRYKDFSVRSFSKAYGYPSSFGYPIRPVFNNRYRNLKEVEVMVPERGGRYAFPKTITWEFKDESDWVKYLP